VGRGGAAEDRAFRPHLKVECKDVHTVALTQTRLRVTLQRSRVTPPRLDTAAPVNIEETAVMELPVRALRLMTVSRRSSVGDDDPPTSTPAPDAWRELELVMLTVFPLMDDEAMSRESPWKDHTDMPAPAPVLEERMVLDSMDERHTTSAVPSMMCTPPPATLVYRPGEPMLLPAGENAR
jgi:hypothetical protein